MNASCSMFSQILKLIPRTEFGSSDFPVGIGAAMRQFSSPARLCKLSRVSGIDRKSLVGAIIRHDCNRASIHRA